MPTQTRVFVRYTYMQKRLARFGLISASRFYAIMRGCNIAIPVL